jgi:hypothetical protein
MAKPKRERTTLRCILWIFLGLRRALGAPDCQKVYLAEVTDDLYDKREELQQTLTDMREFQVKLAPDQQSAVERSALCVHLVNATPGRPLRGNMNQNIPEHRRSPKSANARIPRPGASIEK